MLDVIFYETFTEEVEALKRNIGGRFSCDFTSRTVQESGDAAPPGRIVSIRTQSRIPSHWLAHVGAILSRSTGFDHLLALKPTLPKAIPLGYLQEYASRAVAEHAMMLLMALFRGLPRQREQFARFDRDMLTGKECRGRNLLVVGVGRIGSEVVKIGRGLDMDVRGVDIVRRFDDVAYVDREDGLAWADAVVCAMNLTAENRGYFSADTLGRAPRGVVFINIARGELAPSAGLLELLRSGHLGGLGLDVFEDEPEVSVSLRSGDASSEGGRLVRELAGHTNVILTPHNAFNTLEAVERKARFTVDQIEQFVEHGSFLWQV